MVRLMVSRNLKGQNFTPKMSVKQLRQVEKAVVRAMNDLVGEFQGTYTTFADLAQDKTLQEELEEAELPQPWRLAETAGMLSSWPEGRGVFLNKDRSLCIFVNMEDHVTVMSTISGNGAGDGSVMAQRAFTLAYKALETLTSRLEFEIDDRLGYITPSPAKLGTGLAFSLSLSTSSAAPQSLFEDVERRFQVCVDRAGTPRDGGGKSCLVFSKLSLGVSEVDIIKEVVQASRFLLSSLSETKASS
jgi:protein-arginine kinase